MYYATFCVSVINHLFCMVCSITDVTVWLHYNLWLMMWLLTSGLNWQMEELSSCVVQQYTGELYGAAVHRWIVWCSSTQVNCVVQQYTGECEYLIITVPSDTPSLQCDRSISFLLSSVQAWTELCLYYYSHIINIRGQ